MDEKDPSMTYEQAFTLDFSISQTIKWLKIEASKILCRDLTGYSVWVFSQKKFDDASTLQDLCGMYSGVVRIFFVLRPDVEDSKIDIIKILKLNQEPSTASTSSDDCHENDLLMDSKESSNVTTKWIPSDSFKALQKRHRIPSNLDKWSELHVSIWIDWAKEEFKLKTLNPSKNHFDGKALLKVTEEKLKTFAPYDPFNFFRMHFELLKTTNTVATLLDFPLEMQHPTPSQEEESCVLFKADNNGEDDLHVPMTSSSSATPPCQLWIFLLELLINHKASNLISWIGDCGEFKFHQPNAVARMWGARKGNESMTYDKLSRSLRYYYESDTKILNKVPHKKFSYKFEMNLREILGYSPREIQEQMRYVRLIS